MVGAAWRDRVWIRPRLIVALAVLGLATPGVVLVGRIELETHAAWGTFVPASGPPPRIEWCGRRYYPGSSPISAADVLTPPEGSGLRQVATSPSGYAVFADPLTATARAQYDTNVCAMGVYLKLGPNSYLPYGLSGGP